MLFWVWPDNQTAHFPPLSIQTGEKKLNYSDSPPKIKLVLFQVKSHLPWKHNSVWQQWLNRKFSYLVVGSDPWPLFLSWSFTFTISKLVIKRRIGWSCSRDLWSVPCWFHLGSVSENQTLMFYKIVPNRLIL